MTRQCERRGRTKGAAEQALADALRARARFNASGDINTNTRFAIVAESWFEEFSAGDASPSTIERYRRHLDNTILIALGELRLHEVTTGSVGRFLQSVQANHGPVAAKQCKSIVSSVAKVAMRHDAMDRNPTREVGAISTKPKKKRRNLTPEDLLRLRELLRKEARTVERDVPELIDFLICTGMRIGEASAVEWDAVSLTGGTVEVRGTVIRIKGEGLVVRPAPKTDAGYRTLVLPNWCVGMLKRRKLSSTSRWVFCAPNGGLRDSSNTNADLKDAFADAGFSGVTSHTFRHAVATMMDQAGLSSRAAADQLGHARPSMTMDVYMGRGIVDTGAAAVLERLGTPVA